MLHSRNKKTESARRRKMRAYLAGYPHIMIPFSLPWLTIASYSAFNIVAVVVLGFVNTKTIERGDTD
jgi:hypothetical protein